jgi:pyruvate/2-oxoacid:ferredoxin oxidoreductase alpha subunit
LRRGERVELININYFRNFPPQKQSANKKGRKVLAENFSADGTKAEHNFLFKESLANEEEILESANKYVNSTQILSINNNT